MQIVYPPESHHTFEASTFVIGSVTSGASLLVSGEPVSVSSSGYFSWPVALQPGTNTIELVEKWPDGTITGQTRTIVRDSALVISDLSIAPELLLPYAFPVSDGSASPGETLTLMCPAPPGARVSVAIEGLLTRPLWLQPVESMDTREGVFAHLHQIKPPMPPMMAAAIQIPHGASTPGTFTVAYTLHHDNHTLSLQASGRLTLIPAGQTRTAIVTAENTLVRTHPDGGSRLTPQLKGTFLRVSHLQNGHYKAHFGETRCGWLSAEDLSFCDTPKPPEQAAIHTVLCQSDGNDIEIRLPMNRCVPHEIFPDSDRVRIRLYDTISRCDFIHYPPGVFERGLREIQWTQIDPATVELEIRLSSPLQGLHRHYDVESQALILKLKTANSLREAPYTVVIDPGHGGTESGAIAPNGTPEKDLNLAMALNVREALKRVPGIEVVLTRDEDSTVSLEERVAIATAAKADLLLSLHHNALPDGRDPLKESGVSTFYYYPFALPAARHFQQHLVAQTEFNDYGILYDSLHMCRVMAMPSLLLELGFLTHPADAEKCLDASHQEQTANAIAGAVQSLFNL